MHHPDPPLTQTEEPAALQPCPHLASPSVMQCDHPRWSEPPRFQAPPRVSIPLEEPVRRANPQFVSVALDHHLHAHAHRPLADGLGQCFPDAPPQNIEAVRMSVQPDLTGRAHADALKVGLASRCCDFDLPKLSVRKPVQTRRRRNPYVAAVGLRRGPGENALLSPHPFRPTKEERLAALHEQQAVHPKDPDPRRGHEGHHIPARGQLAGWRISAPSALPEPEPLRLHVDVEASVACDLKRLDHLPLCRKGLKGCGGGDKMCAVETPDLGVRHPPQQPVCPVSQILD